MIAAELDPELLGQFEADVEAAFAYIHDVALVVYDLEQKVNRIVSALEIMLAEPGSPHSSAAEARAALSGE